MNLRSIVLTFAALLLLASIASADQPALPGEPADALLAAIFAGPESPDCAGAQLPALAPAPVEKAGVPCGACSDTICLGRTFGQYCKFQNGRFYYCQPAYVRCDPNDCECWTGPLP